MVAAKNTLKFCGDPLLFIATAGGDGLLTAATQGTDSHWHCCSKHKP